MSRKIAIFIIAVLVILLAITLLLVIRLSRSGDSSSSPYSAVYLSTGDIYFGRLTWFPKPKLTNVWFIQQSVGAEGSPQFGIAPISGTFWGPESEISLNLDNVVFWTRLRADSEVVKVMENPSDNNQLESYPQLSQ